MKVSPVKTIKTLIRNYRYQREERFLNKYCHLDDNLPRDVYRQLCTARGGRCGLADYARSKGVTIDISDAEQKVAKDFYEFDIDEKHAKQAAENNIAITVTQEKPQKKNGIGIINSLTSYISKDTSQINQRKVPDHFVVELPWDGLQQVRLTSHEWEENFLKTVYRAIENMANSLSGKK